MSVGASSLNLGYCQQGIGAALSVSGRVFKMPRREISQPLCATYISEVLPPCDFSPPQYPIFFKLQIVSSVTIMLLDIAAKNLALQSLKKTQTKQTPTNQKATLIRLLWQHRVNMSINRGTKVSSRVWYVNMLFFIFGGQNRKESLKIQCFLVFLSQKNVNYCSNVTPFMTA